jgi:hypothetical protein
LSIETVTKIGLISKALILCGEKPLNSLTEDRYGATVGANLFEMIYENELQSNRWRFSVKKGALSRLVAAPLNQWLYAYQLPTDCLLPLHVYPVANYEIYGDRIYTDLAEVELDYQFKPDVSDVPAYFATLMTYALARDMINPITASKTDVEVMSAKYRYQRGIALFADAQGRPATTVQRNPFVDVRGAR